MPFEATFLAVTLTRKVHVHSQGRRIFEVPMAARSRGNTSSIGSHAHVVGERRVCVDNLQGLYSATITVPSF